MKILAPIDTSQNLVIRPRLNIATVDLTIRDLLKDITTVSSDISTSFTDGYLTIPFSHDFNEGETFFAEVTNSSDDSLVWRGLIYITSQATQNYNYFS